MRKLKRLYCRLFSHDERCTKTKSYCARCRRVLCWFLPEAIIDKVAAGYERERMRATLKDLLGDVAR